MHGVHVRTEATEAVDCLAYVEGKAAQASFVQLTLRRLISAPVDAPGRVELRSASANQPLGPRWPAIPAFIFT